MLCRYECNVQIFALIFKSLGGLQFQSVQIPSDPIDSFADIEISLLSPIGNHRKLHVVPSKGNQSKKRKRSCAQDEEDEAKKRPIKVIDGPPLQKSLTIGLNATTRHLESQVHNIKANENEANEKSTQDLPPMQVVFLLKGRNDVIYTHLPLLVQAASLANPVSSPCLLVPLASVYEKDLASALGIPRAGVVGLVEGAPGFGALLELVRSKVAPADVPWLREAVEAKYLGTKIEQIYYGQTK